MVWDLNFHWTRLFLYVTNFFFFLKINHFFVEYKKITMNHCNTINSRVSFLLKAAVRNKASDLDLVLFVHEE